MFALALLVTLSFTHVYALSQSSADCRTFLYNITARAINKATDGSLLPVSGTWALSFRHCTPAFGPVKPALQICVHGASYTQQYWDWPIDSSRYSYVEYAARRGYATLTYDRLGSGDSARPDPVNVVQPSLQIAIAKVVISLARNGKLLNCEYSKIIHVGHSFGSVLTTGVLASAPWLIDIAVLTGYAHHPVPAEIGALAHLTPARDVDPVRFGKLDPGFLTTLNITTRAAVFYSSAPGAYSPDVLAYDECTKGTFAQGELSNSVGAAPGFRGTIGAFIGLDDILNCDPGCTNMPNESSFFPAATYEYTTVPNTAHCLNLHYTAPSTFGLIHNFLAARGF
ncbi:hypothetical protein AURDEDRAFT_165245 [Auricularia subglabra TFB-10046 SS5]|nr:hypothetical protein AURDEDRAFT_165245 [Auricularia subglabra TFB-10046 SS5]